MTNGNIAPVRAHRAHDRLHAFKTLARASLLISSVLIALAIAEGLVRLFDPQITPGEYEQRYLIDGRSSNTTGYFTNDAILPLTLKPNYRHEIVDLAWHPKQFSVSLDSRGYRNSLLKGQEASVVFLGDSLVFGYGVEEEEALPACLGKLMNQKVYNLGIPGTGPESYMVMLERYLRSASAPRRIIVAFTLGNDFDDLSNASWQELAQCHSPASRIYRNDVPAVSPKFSAFVAASVLRFSHLASLFVNVATPREQAAAWQIVQIHRINSMRAVQALEAMNPAPEQLKNSITEALDYAAQLKETTCLNQSNQDLLATYRSRLSSGDWSSAYPLAAQISARLIDHGCHAMNKKEFKNVLAYFNRYGAYVWRVAAVQPQGDIMVYDRLLDRMKRSDVFQEYAVRLDVIQKKLRTHQRDVGIDIQSLNDQLGRQFRNPFEGIPAGCNKLDIFLERIRNLAAQYGSELLLVSIPAEYQLAYIRDQKVSDSNLLETSSRHRVPSLSLAPLLIKYYAESDSSLYLDGSHLNPEGNSLAAQWIYEWIQAHPQ